MSYSIRFTKHVPGKEDVSVEYSLEMLEQFEDLTTDTTFADYIQRWKEVLDVMVLPELDTPPTE